MLTGLKKLTRFKLKFTTDNIDLPDGGYVSIDWLKDDSQDSLPEDAPLLLVLHTITGHSGDHGMWISGPAKRGYRIAVFTRRGHGKLTLKSARFNILGDAEDTHLQTLFATRKYPKAKFVAMAGFSAGSGLLVTYLGKYYDCTPVNAGACLCPAYSMDIWDKLDVRYPVVAKALLTSAKTTWLKEENMKVLSDHDEKSLGLLRESERMGDFVRAHSGFATGDKKGCYESWLMYSAPMQHFEKIQVPVFVLNSLDDPVSLAENIPPPQVFNKNPNYLLLVTPKGSHVAYNDGFMGGMCFMSERSVDFFEAVANDSKEFDEK